MYSDKTPLCSLMKIQCWTLNTDWVWLVEANTAVKLPRKKTLHCSKNHWSLCGRLWILSGRFKAESYPGGHLITSELDSLFCASSQKEVDRWRKKIPQTMFPKKPWRSKVTRKAHCFYLFYFYSPLPAIWSCAIYDLTSTFSIFVADVGNDPGLRVGIVFIWANVGLLDFYGSGLKCSLVVSCIVIHIFTRDLLKGWKSC